MSLISRRGFLSTGLAATAAAGLTQGSSVLAKDAGAKSSGVPKFRYCFNTSCVRKAKRPLPELIDMVADAGYDGIEPWIGEIETYVNSGGTLADLRKRLDDHGLQVESAIGFPRWGVNDDADRKAGFEQAKREMDMLKQLGSSRIAAPPAGINRGDYDLIELDVLAERYAALLDLGVSMDVIPQLEIWGSSRNLSKLPQAAYVAMAANHPHAAILPDIYHLYRGGSDFNSLRLLSCEAINIFHVNDYPLSIPREEMKDSDRVYPGDGDAPMKSILQALHSTGFSGVLSLELFNETYFAQPPVEVIQTGLAKMKASVERAFA